MESPVYIQIHNSIKRDIEAGKWAIGDRIPSERELAISFGVSRMTLRQAIQTLVDEGILERRVGAGTYVANQKVQEKMSGVTSFTDIMLAQGKTPSSKTISYHVASPSLSEKEKLNLPDGAQVLRMERIRFADDVPISFEVATVPEALVQDFSKAEVTSSLYRTLEEKANLVLGGAQQTVTAQVSSERIADFLQIKRGDPILRLRQVSFLQSGEPFEYVRTQYVGTRFEFYLER
ncbi:MULTISPECIES: GntR family transcriptional regulator [Loigolactobacillus]|uniref:GntR family transcriptional regulator n=1 Tax=Loigolactobacillus backii TaxID=375175 RepID=A0A192GZA3_9LACO|nr:MULTISPECIES: GntR family transcriptional regulator [Loigolactobacillus]ANK61317.1 GntR family transcriptional regulator [Loigolactobacillus backii]ANK69483.1 GntR family transcriptional regulator [Loigolactobacillus backii]MDA5388137.1 GntR family transcriptional regulator [Loigolactobacillus backii]MDA5390645.1 GntR family transcriptional regulator [Loigolactobacillus backii]PIO84020.1 GntR family transcriptional regulator [Loigolactobacillus backii]